jgi:hypothetical protein
LAGPPVGLRTAVPVRVKRLPAYAPDLNPCEGVFSSLKGRDLANHCPASVADLEAAARSGLERIGDNQELLFGLLRKAGLRLEKRQLVP